MYVALANELVAVPFGLADEYRGYLRYATWLRKGEVFQPVSPDGGQFLNDGTWVNMGDPLYTIPGYDVTIRSPVNGVLRNTHYSCKSIPSGEVHRHILIHPKEGYWLPADTGGFLFNDVIRLICAVEETIASEKRSWWQRKLDPYHCPFGSLNTQAEQARGSREGILQSLEDLENAECPIIPLA